MKFCSLYDTTVVQRIPDGDNRLCYVCDTCHTAHYQNPRIVAGSLLAQDGQVLLYCHTTVPRLGCWTLPAGFMGNGEILARAAARETEEEANTWAGDLQPYTPLNPPHVSQVYLFFRAKLLGLDFSAGDGNLEVRLLDEVKIPRLELAFPTIDHTLEYYFNDHREGCFPVRNEAIAPMLAPYKKDWMPDTRTPPLLWLKGTSGISFPCAGYLLCCT